MSQSEKKLNELITKVNDMSDNITRLEGTISTLSETVTKLGETLTGIVTRLNDVDVRLVKADSEYNDLLKKHKLLQEKVINLESQSRRDNLILEGVPEAPNGSKETQSDCVKKVLAILSNDMKITEANTIRIVRCHRLGQLRSTSTQNNSQARPRAIIMKFHWYGDRDRVWQAKAQLKNTDYFLKEDFPAEIIERRKTLTPIMFAARRKGNSAYLIVDKLHIKRETPQGEKHTVYDVNTLHKLPAELDPKFVSTKQSEDVFAFFGSSCPLSNFYPSPFVTAGQRFSCVEEYYCLKKAEFADDDVSVERIKSAATPALYKAIARSVKVDRTRWAYEETRVMMTALQLKFQQNPQIRDYLLETGDKVIAEASPSDKFWGIGLGLGNEHVTHEVHWSGKNELGKLLMEVRTSYR